MSMREKISSEMLEAYTARVKEMEAPRKKSNRGMLLFLMVCAIFGGILGFFCVYMAEEGLPGLEIVPPFPIKESLEFVYLILAMVGFWLMMLVHIIAHEAGHLVFGLLTGYEFLSFRVGSFTIVKKDGKLIRKKIKTPGLAGQCLMSPPEWKDGEPYPYVWYNLGGGIMNLVLSLLAVPLFFVNVPFLAWVGVFLIIIGVLFAITNLIPMTVGVPNDGKNCLLCRRSKENRRAFYLQLKLNALMSGGMEIKDIPRELFQMGEEAVLNPLTCYVRLVEYYQSVAKGEEEAAEQLLSTLEKEAEDLPTAFLNSIDLERIYRMLLQKRPVEELAVYGKVLLPVFSQGKDLSIFRVKYAYLMLLTEEEREMVEWLVYSKKGVLPKRLPKRKPETAENLRETMKQAYEKHPVIGEAAFYMDLVRRCEEYANK